MAPEAVTVSCVECKKRDRKDAILRRCKICQKAFHDLCHITTAIGKLSYVCKKCIANVSTYNNEENRNNTSNSSIKSTSTHNSQENKNNSSNSEIKSVTARKTKSKLVSKTTTSRLADEKSTNSSTPVKKINLITASTPTIINNKSKLAGKTSPKKQADIETMNSSKTSAKEKNSITDSTPTIISNEGLPDGHPINTQYANISNEDRNINVLTISLIPDHHCSLPSSMLDLFSKQFELLIRLMDDFKQQTIRKLDTINANSFSPSTSTSPPATNEVLSTVTTQISQLKKIIEEQSTKLEALQNDQLKVLEENLSLKLHIETLISTQKSLLNTNHNIQTQDRCTSVLSLSEEEESINFSRVMVPLSAKPTASSPPSSQSLETEKNSNIYSNTETQQGNHKHQVRSKQEKNVTIVSSCSTASTRGEVSENLTSREGSTSAESAAELIVSAIF